MQTNIHFQSAKSLTVKEDVMTMPANLPDFPFHAWLTLEDSAGGSIVLHVHDVETLDKLAFHATALARSIRNARESASAGPECDCPAREAGNADSPDLHTAQCAKSLQHHLIEPTGDLNEEPLRSGYDA